MKILFISHYFPPEGNAPAVRTFENCRRWASLGHEVTVITGAPNVPAGKVYEGYENRWRQEEEVDGIRVIRVWTYIAANKGFLRRIFNYLSFMLFSFWHGLWVPKPDVVIATSPQFFCAVGGYFLARLRRRPFVFEVRDLYPESMKAVDAVNNAAIIKAVDMLVDHMYRRSKGIVVVTDSFKDVIAARGIGADKIAVVKNGVDLDRFIPGPRENVVRKGLGRGVGFVVSYIGTVGMAHGLEIVLDAAERLKDRTEIHFLIVGDGAQREALERSAAQSSLHNVMFVGRVPRDRVPDYIAASDVCLVTLRAGELFETVLPSKMFELLAMSRPIIMSVKGEASRILDASGGGVAVDPGRSDQLADAVLRIQADPSEAARMGERGRKYVIEHFDRAALSDKYLDFLKQMIAG